jgi:hypothetical protein
MQELIYVHDTLGKKEPFKEGRIQFGKNYLIKCSYIPNRKQKTGKPTEMLCFFKGTVT